MKKIIALFIGIITVICALADNNYASCKVNDVSGAYVYAQVFNVETNNEVNIQINSYIVLEGAVNVEFDWSKSDGEKGHENFVVHFRNGKASVRKKVSTNSSKTLFISNVRVYNPVCKVPK